MDMLFDPYADGPFKAGSHAGAITKSRPETGLMTPAFGGGPGESAPRPEAGPAAGPAGGSPAEEHARHQLPDAGALLAGLNPQQEEAVKHSGSALLIVA